jgi:hypothetical protein
MAQTQEKSSSPNVAELSIMAPLSDIHVDYAWNVRSKADIDRETSDAVRDGSRDAGAGFHDFARSFNTGGQDTEVVLSEIRNGKTLRGEKTSKKWELIAGFRRFTAVSLLNSPEETKKRAEKDEKALGPNLQAVANVPDGHIKGNVRFFKDAREARKLNARENTLRSNLQAPDLVRLCLEYANDYKLNQTETAEELGITQTYISKLLKVGSLPPAVIGHWRDGTDLPGGNPPGGQKQLPINDMIELADFAKGATVADVIDRYKGLLSPSGETDDGTTPKGQKVQEELARVGYLCGALVAEGILENGSLAWAAVMGPGKSGFLLNTGPKALTREEQGKFIDIIGEAFAKGVKEHTRAGK